MHKKPKTKSTTMSDQYANQKSGGKNLSGHHGHPFIDCRGPYDHHGPYNEQRGHHGRHRQHGQRGRNYYQPYPRQRESDTARKIAKVQQAPPKPSKERKEEVVKKLLQGVMADGERECNEIVKEWVDDEEYEEELLMDYDYQITVKQSDVWCEEMKLRELLKELPKCNQLTDAFEANAEQVVKCYCPACPDNCKFENTGKMIAHLREKLSKKRGRKNYWEHDNSHELVLAYIQELFLKYKRG